MKELLAFHRNILELSDYLSDLLLFAFYTPERSGVKIQHSGYVVIIVPFQLLQLALDLLNERIGIEKESGPARVIHGNHDRAIGLLSVPARPAGLLIECLYGGRKAVMYGEADVWFIDSHTEGLCANEERDLVSLEFPEHPALIIPVFLWIAPLRLLPAVDVCGYPELPPNVIGYPLYAKFTVDVQTENKTRMGIFASRDV